ncbi:MAG: DUF1273 domain-containing protein [Subdoligranulum sp.]|nr:DUF1273 domain-containing protein [Subdoligranulum sp.]
MDKRKITCCFTGHRELPIKSEEMIWNAVKTRLQPLIAQGVRYFGVGGALGFDMLIAEKLLELRENDPRLKMILVLPFRDYQSRWTSDQRARAARVEHRADKIVYCCASPSKSAFLVRDRHLVEYSAYCIGYCTRAAGGAAYTLRYAKAQGLTVWNVAQDMGLL